MATRRTVALALAVLSLSAAPASALPGPAGSLRVRACVTATTVIGCTTAPLASSATKFAAISADGNTVYTTGEDGTTQGALVAWARDRATGALTLRNCASYDLGTCIGSGGMFLPGQIAVGPHAIYVAGNQGIEVDEFPTAADGSLSPAASCVGAGSCSAPAGGQYTAMTSIRGVAITPDGRTLAVTSAVGGLSIFPLDPTTGAIGARLACLSATVPLPKTCTATPGMLDITAVAATNRAFYVVSGDSTDAGIYEFDRDPIGGSVVSGLDSCVQETLAAVGVSCLHGRGIPDVFRLVTSPDGQSLYGVDPESSTTGYLTTFSLDPTSGHLTAQQSCFGNAGDATCAAEFGLVAPQLAAVSPDGHQIYVTSVTASGGEVAAFTRDASTGSPHLPYLDCIGAAAIACSNSIQGRSSAVLGGTSAVVVDPVDGRDVITIGAPAGGLVTLSREVAPTCSPAAASTTVGVAVAVGVASSCSDANGDPLTFSIAVSPLDGLAAATASGITYTPNTGFLGADAFSFTASDGSLASAPATASLTVAATPPPPVTTSPTTPTTPAPPPSAPAPLPATKLTITAPRKRATTIHGTATDGHAMKSVTVGVTQTLKHHRCRALRATRAHNTGALQAAPSCTTHYTVTAKGTRSWAIKLTHPLAAGTYTISARLRDSTARATTAHRTVVIT
jgi:6-phosphogluconolactonase (cycloisomerase 2 family)